MKNSLLFLALCLTNGLSLLAQKTPPTAVVAAFNKQFTTVKDLDWGREKNGDWEAEFDQNGTEISANFSPDGKWLETETEIKFSDFPAPVQAALKGKKVKEAAKNFARRWYNRL